MKKVSELNQKVMNNFKKSKMKKLIMGLSCLSVLSMVNCDNNETNETNETRKESIFERVSFSADSSSGDFTIKDGDKVTLSITDNNDHFATYYTDADRTSGTDFDNDGTEFTMNEDGTIKGGFYISATDAGVTYKITKFDLDIGGDGNINYVINTTPLEFTLKKGTTARVSLVLVEKKEGSVKEHPGTKPKGTTVSFSVTKQELDQYQFDFTLQKSDGTLFSTEDIDYVIKLEVKDGDKSVYSIPNLFSAIGKTEGKAKNGGDAAEIFTITLPKELSSYSDGGAKLTIEGTYTKGTATIKLPKVSVKDLQPEKEKTIIQAYTAAGVNEKGKGSPYPTGYFGPKVGQYSHYEMPASIPDNIKINVGEDKTIQLLKLDDKHRYNIYSYWKVYRLKEKKPILEYYKVQSSRAKSRSYSINLGKINPYEIDLQKLIPKLHDFITEDLKNFYLEVIVVFKDNKGSSKIAKSPQVKKYYYYFKNPSKANYLRHVSFIPRLTGSTIKDSDKVKLTIKDNNGNLAKYYTAEDQIKGTSFDNEGTEFTLDFIKDGFYLEDTIGIEYKITKFDLASGDINYKLKYDSVIVPASKEQVFVDLVKKQ